MPEISQTIALVEDDASLSRALVRLLRASGFETVAFASAEEFLASDNSSALVCLILDIVLPGLSGLDLLDPAEPTEKKRVHGGRVPLHRSILHPLHGGNPWQNGSQHRFQPCRIPLRAADDLSMKPAEKENKQNTGKRARFFWQII